MWWSGSGDYVVIIVYGFRSLHFCYKPLECVFTYYLFTYKSYINSLLTKLQGLGLRPGVIDGAISISAVQWLCYADKSSHEPRLRLKAFFGSLYRCLARGARAVLQLYAENMDQSEMIMSYAMRAGFAGGVVVDWPHSSKARKAYLVLTCGPPSTQTTLPKGKGENGEMCDDSDESGDEENHTVCNNDRNRPRKRMKISKNGKGREWVLKKKEQRRKKGYEVPPDTKYTNRKRKTRF